MYLFFDTETTGVPRNYKASVEDSNNWPRMVQIAWLVYNSDKIKVDEQQFIIKPEGYIIPKEVSKLHGITTERAISEGKDLQFVLNLFNTQIEESQFIIAHNISFDEKIVGAEFFRKKINSKLFNKPRLCTMHASTNYCKIPGNYGYKWPKLSELHIKLFGKDFEDAHNAAADIEATAKCFWKLRELKLI
ncbi:MAG: 3'-5' exonuclease [Bacteroidetes bacterium CG02_land_8_20_14_3_00_31_25]|nr:MAG: 3'-5' exonuclease [Bacteroidetes bacterium CG02_land_8_20_14_3_00_31_25]